MSGCCARHGQEELFGAKTARRDARRYRRKGPDRTARALARLASRGAEGATVLEIGGGVGQVLLELLRAGAASGEVVELLPAYEPHLRELAREAGLTARVSFRAADLVADPATGSPADIVVLNKVVCCTPDGVELAAVAAGLARRTLVLSHPRDVWWMRRTFAVLNFSLRLRGRRFRAYVHPQAAIEAAVGAQGLLRVAGRDGPFFRSASFERV